MRTKDKIIQISIDLFNRHGASVVTTNHIAKALEISPGNLYFYFRNKEQIIREIFNIMKRETYALWRASRVKVGNEGDDFQSEGGPVFLIERNFELFWKYRFFHREMYYLRRKDPLLSKIWKNHLKKIRKLMMTVSYRWIQKGWFEPWISISEAEFMANVLLATSSSFLQFFESSDKLPAHKHIEEGKKYVIRLLYQLTRGELRKQFKALLNSDQSN